MIEQVTQIHLFYPLLALVLIVLIVAICSVIKYRNGNLTFKDIFFKSSDNAKEITVDTTDKMAKMHDNVVKLDFNSSHENELHSLETGLKELQDNVKDLEKKVDLLIERVVNLEKKD